MINKKQHENKKLKTKTKETPRKKGISNRAKNRNKQQKRMKKI